MKKIQHYILALALMVGVGTVVLPPAVGAVDVFEQCGTNSDSAVCGATGDDAPDMIKAVINTALMVLGMIAVLMIVIGGIRYTTSNGESSKIKEAKDTILYSVIGVVVAILSYTIVNFVLGRF
jgi:hypothetical protein